MLFVQDHFMCSTEGGFSEIYRSSSRWSSNVVSAKILGMYTCFHYFSFFSILYYLFKTFYHCDLVLVIYAYFSFFLLLRFLAWNLLSYCKCFRWESLWCLWGSWKFLYAVCVQRSLILIIPAATAGVPRYLRMLLKYELMRVSTICF